MLDETHYVLDDLQGRILCGVCHMNHLKKAKLRTPSGTATTYDELQDTFSNAVDKDNSTTPLPDIAPAAVFQSLFSLNVSITSLHPSSIVTVHQHYTFVVCR